MKKLVTFFRTSGYFFMYVAYDNKILEITEQVYYLLPSFLAKRSKRYIWEKFKDRFTRKEMNGFFSACRREKALRRLTGEVPPVRMSNPLRHRRKLKFLYSKINRVCLNVTDDCNLKCKYCIFSDLYPTEKNRSDKHMNIDTARKALRFIKEHSVHQKEVYVSFYGGEPFLEFDLIKKTVEYANRIFRSRKIYYNITTNATLLNREICNFLVRNEFTTVISLDGPENINNRYRVFKGGGGTFRQIIRSIEMLRSLHSAYFKKHVIFSCVLIPPYRFNDIGEYFNCKLNVGPEKVWTNFAALGADFKNYEILKETKEDAKNYSNIHEKYVRERMDGTEPARSLYSQTIFDKLYLPIVRRNMSDVSNVTFHPTGQCLPFTKKLYVDTNGDFHICEKVEHSCPLGNVDDGYDLARINRLFDDYYNDMIKNCSRCWAFRMCPMCIINALKEGRYNGENIRKLCSRHRKGLKKGSSTIAGY